MQDILLRNSSFMIVIDCMELEMWMVVIWFSCANFTF